MYWNLTEKERLVTAFTLAASDKELMENFLNDLLTEKELKELIMRLHIMCLLKDCASYKKISEYTGASPSTIARLAKKVDKRKSGFQEIIRKFEKLGKAYSD